MKMHVSAQSDNLKVNRFSGYMSPGAQVPVGSHRIWVLSISELEGGQGNQCIEMLTRKPKINIHVWIRFPLTFLIT